MKLKSQTELTNWALGSQYLWLFLDYDGTLADFAPTPEVIRTDPRVIGLLEQLVNKPNIRVTVVSGRRLRDLRLLLPIEGIFLAGIYGIELLKETGEIINRVAYNDIRPSIETVKPQWEQLISGRKGFFLEDKGWALALHARFASDAQAEQVLSAAKGILDHVGLSTDFRVLGGSKFLEVGPVLANKGKTVEYLLDRFEWPGALLVFIGDDDKDEEAFAVIQSRGGIAVVVAAKSRPSLAQFRLDTPMDVRRWLQDLTLRLR